MATYRLLLIEDRYEDAAMYRAILVGGNPPFLYDVDLVWERSPPPIDFYATVDGVITDYNLGKDNGVTVARAIRLHYPKLPMMLMTGMLPPYLPQQDRNLFVAVVEKDDLSAVWDGAREVMRRVSGYDQNAQQHDQTPGVKPVHEG